MHAWVQGYVSIIESPPAAGTLGNETLERGYAEETGSYSGAHTVTVWPITECVYCDVNSLRIRSAVSYSANSGDVLAASHPHCLPPASPH